MAGPDGTLGRGTRKNARHRRSGAVGRRSADWTQAERKTRVQHPRATAALWPVSDRATASTAGLTNSNALRAAATLLILRQ
jgi:hypothetical protein